jgi:hypothetical protein
MDQQGLINYYILPAEIRNRHLIARDDLLTPIKVWILLKTLALIIIRSQSLNQVVVH